MKKHVFALFMGIILGFPLVVSGNEGKDHYFHPFYKKSFSRVKTSSKINSFKDLGLRRTNHPKKTVFINWRRLHWGKLSDLIQPSDRGEEQVEDSEELQELTGELRRELKSFAKQYGLKIIWRKRGKYWDCPDVAEEFIEYWNKGISQKKDHGFLSLASLSPATSESLKSKGARQ